MGKKIRTKTGFKISEEDFLELPKNLKNRLVEKDGVSVYGKNVFGKGVLCKKSEKLAETIKTPYNEWNDFVDGKYVCHPSDLPLIPHSIRKEGSKKLKFYIEFIKLYKKLYNKKFNKYHNISKQDYKHIDNLYHMHISIGDMQLVMINAFESLNFTILRAKVEHIYKYFNEYLCSDLGTLTRAFNFEHREDKKVWIDKLKKGK